MIYKYGIDFGTTNSSIAIRFVGDDKQEHTLVVDVKDTLPRETIPSVVLADDKGNVVAGEEDGSVRALADEEEEGAVDDKGRNDVRLC